MNRPAAAVLHAALSILLFVVIFGVVWCATFFLLWESIYGDSYGGRWAIFAWPVAFSVAISAVAAYLLRSSGYEGVVRPWMRWLAIPLLLAFAGAWIWSFEYLYGVAYGNQWKDFIWPVTIALAIGAAGILFIWMLSGQHVNTLMWAPSILFMLLFSIALIWFTDRYLLDEPQMIHISRHIRS